MNMRPWMHTGVGGLTGTTSVPPPGRSETRSSWAVRSHT